MTDLHDRDRELGPDDHRPDSIVIFTESQSDANFYNRLVGRRLREHVRFVAPNAEQKTNAQGWSGAVDFCRKYREDAKAVGLPANRYYCMLDGEESVRWGTGLEIFNAKSLLFQVDDPEAEGMLFLNCFEKENLYLLYANAIEEIEYNLDLFGEPRPILLNDPKAAEFEESEDQKTWKTYFLDAKEHQRKCKPKKSKKKPRGFQKQSTRRFGRHNFWQGVIRSLLHAGLVAACKRPRGEKDRPNLYAVGELAHLTHRTGRLFEEAIFYRNGMHLRQHGLNNETPDKAEEDAITMRFWKEIVARFARLRSDHGIGSIKRNPFAPELMRLCDGKALLEWMFNAEHAAWEKTYEQRLVDNGFGRVFQKALVGVLTGEPDSKPADAPRWPFLRPPLPPIHPGTAIRH